MYVSSTYLSFVPHIVLYLLENECKYKISGKYNFTILGQKKLPGTFCFGVFHRLHWKARGKGAGGGLANCQLSTIV